MKRRNFLLLTPAAGVVALTACDDTKLVESWSADGGPITLKNVLAVAIQKGSRRRVLEDAMVDQIVKTGAKATQSHLLFPDDTVKDQPECKRVIAEKGFDGAVFLQLVDATTEQYYRPASYRYADFPVWRRSMWGYWGQAWPVVYDPGYSMTSKIVTMETTVYDVAKDRILWGGISKSTDPANSDKLVASIAKAAVKDMRAKGLLIAKG